MKRSQFDVLVPCYNYGRYLNQCVHSILAQVDVDVRVLIVDDASTDCSTEVAQRLTLEDSRVQVHRHRSNLGHIATYNEGIAWASSEFFLLISADDYLVPGALARAAQLMRSDDSIGLVFGSFIELAEDGTSVTNIPPMVASRPTAVLDGEEFIARCSSGNPVATATAVVRTALQHMVGGYRPQLPHTGDMEMWWRLARHGKVGILQSVQGVWRKHQRNMSDEYMLSHRLPDLEQKKAAIAWFVSDDPPLAGASPPPAMNSSTPIGSLQRTLFEALGIEAIGRASGALEGGCGEHVWKPLVDFAVRIHPRVKSTWAWRRLLAKRAIGARAAMILSPLHRTLRQAVRRAAGRP